MSRFTSGRDPFDSRFEERALTISAVAATAVRVRQDALSTAFVAAISRPGGSTWEIRRVGDIDVSWAEGYADPDRTIYFNIAYWTRDDLVLHVFGRPVDMETAIRRLG